MDDEQALRRQVRPKGKDDLRAQARELRRAGRTYDEIQDTLGVSKSSISLWVRDLPKPPRRQTAEQRRQHMQDICWSPRRELRENERRITKAAAAREVGKMTDRELFIAGISLYWAEGSKDKSYSRRERVTFVNSDPNMIRVFLAWLGLVGVDRSRLRFAVQIHESADVEAAEGYWRELVGAASDAFCKTTLKKHNPKTNRRNIEDGYRGCLAVRVLEGADLYRRIEGWWYGIVGATQEHNSPAGSS